LARFLFRAAFFSWFRNRFGFSRHLSNGFSGFGPKLAAAGCLSGQGANYASNNGADWTGHAPEGCASDRAGGLSRDRGKLDVFLIATVILIVGHMILALLL
jgi:hypothetical protein